MPRGKNGKDQRSFGFAHAFGRETDSAQPCCLSERQRTDANGCTKSTSWGSLFEPSTAHRKSLHMVAPWCQERRHLDLRGNNEEGPGKRTRARRPFGANRRALARTQTGQVDSRDRALGRFDVVGGGTLVWCRPLLTMGRSREARARQGQRDHETPRRRDPRVDARTASARSPIVYGVIAVGFLAVVRVGLRRPAARLKLPRCSNRVLVARIERRLDSCTADASR